jgi:hypothetical protein
VEEEKKKKKEEEVENEKKVIDEGAHKYSTFYLPLVLPVFFPFYFILPSISRSFSLTLL